MGADGEILRIAHADFQRLIAGNSHFSDIFIRILSARRERSEEHTSELQSLMRISYAVFCLKKKKHQHEYPQTLYKYYSTITASYSVLFSTLQKNTVNYSPYYTCYNCINTKK